MTSDDTPVTLDEIARVAYTAFRRSQAVKQHWPHGVLEICERLGIEHPPWNFWWEWPPEMVEQPARFKARSNQYVDGVPVRDAHGTTEEDLLEDMRLARSEAVHGRKWQAVIAALEAGRTGFEVRWRDDG